MKLKRMSIITALLMAQVSSVVPVSAQSSAAIVPDEVEVSESASSGVTEQQQSLKLQTQDENAARGATNKGLTPNSNLPEAERVLTEDQSLDSQLMNEDQVASELPEREVIEGKEIPPSDSPVTREIEAQDTKVTPNASSDELVLIMNSANMYHNGKLFKAAQPMAVKNGVSYISIRAMVEQAGLKLKYDNTTKETIILKDGNELRFTTDSSNYKVNGASRPMKGPSYQYKNTFMVPLTSITQALGIPYKVNQAEKKVILDLSGISNGNGGTGGGSVEIDPAPSIPDEPGLILMMNSDKMYHNGKLYTAGQPMAVKNGVSYVAIRSLVDRVGLKLTYDSKTKETVIIRGSDELRFKTDSKIYTVNGAKTTMKGAAYQSKNVFMVPLTSITQALDIPYKVDQSNKRIILNLSTKPVGTFTVENKEIFAGQTTVKYKTNTYSPSGLPIINENWEGREDVFAEPGIKTITYSVQDSSGEWSDPYSVTIEVLVPNEPPVALFATDKEEYKMGEKITYTDQSTDDENAIVNWDWDNNAAAFFTPGPVRIGLTVTDKHGATNYYEKTIIITSETLYTREEFGQLFSNIGEEYIFDGSKVPSMNQVSYTRTSEPVMLIRSNSPETVYTEGIVYRETGIGSTRFMIHHRNATGKRVKMYVVATNINDTSAQLTTEYVGFGGPSDIPTATGKTSVQRFFESMQTGNDYETIYLKPGESRTILKELSALPMKNDQVISLFADLYTDSPIRYEIVMVEESKDPIQKLPFLRLHPSDGIHNRGTYSDSTRLIESSELVGNTPARLAIGDKVNDPNLTGYDGITGYATSNAGNFGVVYHIRMHRVSPNTLISMNPRGGKYMGVIMVNGIIVGAPNAGSASAPNEASILFRTGSYEQAVDIVFTAAPGSSLPINFLFTPLPELKTN
ncbi:stalk domain-containing protein [Paenibacillus dakarensis]|uniref:stalk domain-containing protein n=1 Tax=Paenibacillus dakarensis TaxID=1527293 RepID=UPI0006D53C32|nr:stalk domain-containing protein [Paenibacillus dakarensis]